jgi:LuxR family maltose regulon positive regulatory protein
MAGDLAATRQQAAYAVRFGEDHELPKVVAHGRYFLSAVHYQRNELAAAETTLVDVTKNRYSQHPSNFAHSAFMLALIHQIRGRTDEADRVGESVVGFALDTGSSAVLQLARAFQAELALRQGRLAEASWWTEPFVAQPFVLMYRFYVPQLTMARVLLAQGTTGSRAQAAELLDPLHDFLLRTHNTPFRIDVLALQALLCDARGEEPAALEKLSAALALAEPGGFIRPFADLGPQLANLLAQLSKQDVRVDYVGQILALLEQPLRNNEIADKLFVSRETVKSHLKNLYRKLNAGNRLEAVAKAQALGVLPQR